jgi:SWI/SNF-related matrix-associated actin-dependent regulator 1 of chromatin subfamily A
MREAARAAKEADKQAIAAAVETLRNDLAKATASTESRSARARSDAEAEAAREAAAEALRTARQDALLARDEADRAHGELLVAQRSEARAQSLRAEEAARREEAEAELTEQDLYLAQLTNELRLAHDAALAAAAERDTLGRRLAERVQTISEFGDPHRAAVDGAAAAARAARLADERARHEAQRAAAERATSEALRIAYADLHALASRRLDALAAALADAGSRELTLRREAVDTGTLLLRTHVALQTDLESAPRLLAVRQRLEELAYAPPPTVPDELLRPLEPREPPVPRTIPAIRPDGLAGGGLAREAWPPEAPPTVAAAITSADASVVAEPSEPPATAAPPPAQFESEVSFLRKMAASLAEHRLVDERAGAALQLHATMVAAGTSLLRAPSHAHVGFATSATERARRADAYARRQQQRADARAKADSEAALAEAREQLVTERQQAALTAARLEARAEAFEEGRRQAAEAAEATATALRVQLADVTARATVLELGAAKVQAEAVTTQQVSSRRLEALMISDDL